MSIFSIEPKRWRERKELWKTVSTTVIRSIPAAQSCSGWCLNKLILNKYEIGHLVLCELITMTRYDANHQSRMLMDTFQSWNAFAISFSLRLFCSPFHHEFKFFFWKPCGIVSNSNDFNPKTGRPSRRVHAQIKLRVETLDENKGKVDLLCSLYL